jgi:hypothetical protein
MRTVSDVGEPVRTGLLISLEMLNKARVHAVKEASPGECGEVEDHEDGSISGYQESPNREMMFVSQLSLVTQ